jgi:hypothetical protein
MPGQRRETEKPDLRGVTLCTADSANLTLTARALRLSMAACDFADAILFSHVPVAGPFRAVEIDRFDSTAAYSNFVFKRLLKWIETPYVLIVQWDGYIVDPRCDAPPFANMTLSARDGRASPRPRSSRSSGWRISSAMRVSPPDGAAGALYVLLTLASVVVLGWLDGGPRATGRR